MENFKHIFGRYESLFCNDIYKSILKLHASDFPAYRHVRIKFDDVYRNGHTNSGKKTKFASEEERQKTRTDQMLESQARARIVKYLVKAADENEDHDVRLANVMYESTLLNDDALEKFLKFIREQRKNIFCRIFTTTTTTTTTEKHLKSSQKVSIPPSITAKSKPPTNKQLEKAQKRRDRMLGWHAVKNDGRVKTSSPSFEAPPELDQPLNLSVK